MRMEAASEVTLFWDGGCPLCTKEILYYQELDQERRVDWVDITRQQDRLQAAGIS